MMHITKPDVFKYWEYSLCYVIDVLVVSHTHQKVVGLISSRYILKEISVKEPYLYLGTHISKHMILGSDDLTNTR